MFLKNSFGKNLDILQRSMDVSLLRRRVISNNIANSDTPNFKRTTVNFESELKRALESQNKKSGLEARMNNSRHIAFDQKLDYRNVKPKKVLDYLSTSKNNGNNVDLEVEMMDSLENQLMYQLMTQSISNQIQKINIVLR